MLIDDTVIEFARPVDADEIGLISKNDIEYNLGWRYTPEKIKKLIKNNTKNVVVARLDNKLTGFGIMTYHEEQANLDLLAVKSYYRRNRIGSQIVKWLEKVAITAGIQNIIVQVREINKEAIEFYKSLGFITIEKKQGFYKSVESGVIMSKSLRNIFSVT